MQTEIAGIAAMFGLALLISIPLGKYLAKVYNNEKTLLDPLMNPVEKLIYKLSGINAHAQMNWKQHMVAMLALNLVWFVVGMAVLMNMHLLPLNLDGNPGMSADLAFNTSLSFVVNCNL
ncbi:MAG: potassium-transporting ATPase subunit KdpA, partial [Chitinophagaceae bacterium]|nr:potassium-transporting ATPase subunit KdpA [Chitinophagaceae bacterium]